MKQGYLIYKCRLCGEQDTHWGVPDYELAVIHLSSGIPLPKEWGYMKPGLIQSHFCHKGGTSQCYGVMDLIGGRPDLPLT